ncbi:hypothetical protein DMUE_6308, partial [Dictyocoela muelleri]
MINFEIIKSQKNKENIICNNFIYNYNAKCKNYISWRCVRRGCSGMLKTNLEKTQVVEIKNHYHEPENQRLAKIRCRNILKKVAICSNDEFISSFINVTNKMSEEDKYSLCKYDSYRDYFNRLRNMNKNINNCNKDDILDSLKYTFDNELFLQHDSGSNDEERIIMFYTEKNLDILSKSNVWLLDGTFYTSPIGFEQILIIH